MKTVRPGIRLKGSGKYVATKSIDGQRHYKEFKTMREAELWKNKFHPVAHKVVAQSFTSPALSSGNDFANGRDKMITVKEVYEKYLSGPAKSLGTYLAYSRPLKMNRFLPPIFTVKMADLDPEVITNLLDFHLLNVSKGSRRENFKEELKHLAAILNWYREEKDFTFVVPITKHHQKVTVSKEKEETKKHIPLESLIKFIDHLPGEMLKSLATIQYLYGLRIAEVCALTTDCVDFTNKKIHLKKSLTWVKGVPALKKTTKTEDEAELKMTEEAEFIFRSLEATRPKGCKHFFHDNGELPRYRPIFDAYNKALKDAGITEVTGTHFIRHSAATISRKHGGIDASQALLRHKSSAMSEHYAKLDINEKASEVVIFAEKAFVEARATNATKREKSLNVSGS